MGTLKSAGGPGVRDLEAPRGLDHVATRVSLEPDWRGPKERGEIKGAGGHGQHWCSFTGNAPELWGDLENREAPLKVG